MSWWYLSFVDENDKWLGSAIIDVPTEDRGREGMLSAVRAAKRRGIMAGGEVLGGRVDSLPEPRFLNRLLSMAELTAALGAVEKFNYDIAVGVVHDDEGQN